MTGVTIEANLDAELIRGLEGVALERGVDVPSIVAQACQEFADHR